MTLKSGVLWKASLTGVVVGASLGLPGIWPHLFQDNRPCIDVPPPKPLIHRSVAELREPLLAVFETSCGTMGERERAAHERDWNMIKTSVADDVIKVMTEVTRNGEASGWAIGNMGSWIERQKVASPEFLDAIRQRYTNAASDSEDLSVSTVFRYVANHGDASDVAWMDRKTQQIEPERRRSFEVEIEALKKRLAESASLSTGRKKL